MNAVKLWLQRMWASEPVRTALFPLVAALVAWLVRQGVVDQSLGAYLLAFVAAVLGVGATALIRAQVTPPATLQAAITERVEPIVERANAMAVDAQALIASAVQVNLPPEVIDAVNRVRATVDDYVGDHRIP